MRTLPLIALSVLVAGAPMVAAQTAETQVNLRLVDLPSDPIEIEGNSSEDVPFSVELQAENFACTGQGTLPVELSLDASPGAPDEFAVDPTELAFEISPGTYSAANPYNSSMESTFTVAVDGPVGSDHTHEPAINAEFLPDGVENCGSAGGFPSESVSGSVVVEMVADDGGTGGPGGGGGSNGGGGTDGGVDDGGDGNGIPGPGAAAVAATLAVAARGLRRR